MDYIMSAIFTINLLTVIYMHANYMNIIMYKLSSKNCAFLNEYFLRYGQNLIVRLLYC